MHQLPALLCSALLSPKKNVIVTTVIIITLPPTSAHPPPPFFLLSLMFHDVQGQVQRRDHPQAQARRGGHSVDGKQRSQHQREPVLCNPRSVSLVGWQAHHLWSRLVGHAGKRWETKLTASKINSWSCSAAGVLACLGSKTPCLVPEPLPRSLALSANPPLPHMHDTPFYTLTRAGGAGNGYGGG